MAKSDSGLTYLLLPMGNLALCMKGVSHELNSHLSIAISRLEILEELIVAKEDHDLLEQVLVISKKMEESGKLAKGVGHFSINQQKREKVFNFDTIVGELFLLIQKELSYQNIELTSTPPKNALTVNGEFSSLLQSFLGILNALVYQRKGKEKNVWNIRWQGKNDTLSIFITHDVKATEEFQPTPLKDLTINDLDLGYLTVLLKLKAEQIIREHGGDIRYQTNEVVISLPLAEKVQEV